MLGYTSERQLTIYGIEKVFGPNKVLACMFTSELDPATFLEGFTRNKKTEIKE